LTWYNKENCWTNKSFTCFPLCTDDHILEWSSAPDTSVIDNWKINNPTFDVVNDVNQNFSLKYSNNKMGINDVINKLSINNTHAKLLHWKLIKRNLDFNEWMHKLKKLKTKSCARLIHSLLFIFSLMIDSFIKQQTAWSQGSSKYQKQKKCTRSVLINLSFYVYIIPKRNNYSSNSNEKKRKMATILKLAI
jgi:hypothetical protein